MPVYQQKPNAFTIGGLTYEKASTGTWFWCDQAVVHEVGAILDVLQEAVNSQCFHCANHPRVGWVENQKQATQIRELKAELLSVRREVQRTATLERQLADQAEMVADMQKLGDFIQRLPPRFGHAGEHYVVIAMRLISEALLQPTRETSPPPLRSIIFDAAKKWAGEKVAGGIADAFVAYERLKEDGGPG